MGLIFCLNQLLSKHIWPWACEWVGKGGPWEFQAQILLTGNKITSTTHVEHLVLPADVKCWDAKLLMEFSTCVFHGFLNRQSSLLSELPTESKLHPKVEWVFIYIFLLQKETVLLTLSLVYAAISSHLLKMLRNEPNMKLHVAFQSVWPQSTDQENARV